MSEKNRFLCLALASARAAVVISGSIGIPSYL